MRLLSKVTALALTSTILTGWALSAAAETTGENTTVNIKPLTPSPNVIHPEVRFATYYMDWAGTALTLCTRHNDISGLCLSDPPEAGNALSETIGFGSEGFWYMASAQVTGPNGLSGSWEAALEAAFNNEIVQAKDEFAFARIRIRIDTPVAGIYTVEHPYGVETFTVTNPDDGINSTLDIGGQFADNTGPSRSSITQFLKPVTAGPTGYLGNPNTDTRVTGSPRNFNRVSVRIEPLPGETGDTQTFSTDQFQIMGKYHTGEVVTALSVGRATVDGDRLELLAHAPPTALVTAEYETAGTSTQPGVQKKIHLKGDGSGAFFAVADLVTEEGQTLAAELPKDNSVKFSAEVEGRALTSLPAKVTDAVYIDAATYNTGTGALAITARSSMGKPLKLEPTTVILSGGPGLNDFKAGAPPARVKVKSDAGGFDIRVVDIIGDPVAGTPPATTPPPDGGTTPPPSPSAPKTTADTQATTQPFTAVLVDVLGNDTQTEGASPLNTASIAIGTQPDSAKGTISQIGPQGILVQPTKGSVEPITFTYTVKNMAGVVSVPTEVRVAIVSEQLTGTAELRTGRTEWRITGTTNAMRDNTVAAYLVYLPSTDPNTVPAGVRRTTIGSAVADPATGGFSIRSRGTPSVSVPSGSVARILLESSKGTQSLISFTSRN